MLKISICLTLLLCHWLPLQAAETCSRVAVINYQDVLVDTNTTQKGEGLRFHLEKDPKAKMYLDAYQEGTQIKWQNALMGTAGTGMIITGLLTNSDKSDEKKKILLTGGITLIALNFLVARTVENGNESNLINAIEEYNKRNLPKIYFNPRTNDKNTRGPSGSISFFMEQNWKF